LLAACLALGGCPTGEAKITPGFELRARHVVHAVGPVWSGGGRDEERLLASCYRRSLEIADQNRLDSIAFPAISTGVYGFPAKRAAIIAVDTVAETLPRFETSLTRVIFCCFSPGSAELHRAALAARQGG
jgi:O-acetyl-ADP-ribose deacetylase